MFTVDRNIYQKMLLLKKLVDCYRNEQPLKRPNILLIQHQLENHYAQTVALRRLGANPKKIFWIEIPYSSHPEVGEALYELGIPRENFSTSEDYRANMSYKKYQRH